MVSLPDDAVLKGYVRNGWEWSAVYSSKSVDFEGTEEQFINAGYAYKYTQLGKYARVTVNN